MFILAYLFMIIASMLIREFVYGFTAYKCGDYTVKEKKKSFFNLKKIDYMGLASFLFIGFGWVRSVDVDPFYFRNYKKGQRILASSGILTNFILAVLFSCLMYFFSYDLLILNNNFAHFLGYSLQLGFYINISCCIFHMFPVYPLSGFEFMRTLLKPDNKFINFMRKFGYIILILFVVTSSFDYLYGYFLKGFQIIFDSFWGLF